MKSRITVEFQVSNLETGDVTPCIELRVVPSDDVRDKLLKQFVSRLGYESQWCQVYCKNTLEDGTQTWVISPISPKDLESQLALIQNTIIKQ